MKKIAIILFVLVTSSVLAQTTEDVIYLKDGSIYRGEVIENIINDIVKIKTHDDNLIVLKYENISSLKKEPLVLNNKRINLQQDTSKLSLFNPEFDFQYLAGTGSTENSTGIGGSLSVLFNFSDRFSIGLTNGLCSMNKFSEDLTPGLTTNNNYNYSAAYNVVTQPISKKTDYNYYYFGLRTKVYLTAAKRIKQYVSLNMLYSKALNTNEEILFSSTSENKYTVSNYSGGVSTSTSYPYITKTINTIKYLPGANIISLGYGLEVKTSYKINPFIELTYNALKTSYVLRYKTENNYTGIAPSNNYSPPSYDFTRQTKLIINTFNFKVGVKI